MVSRLEFNDVEVASLLVLLDIVHDPRYIQLNYKISNLLAIRFEKLAQINILICSERLSAAFRKSFLSFWFGPIIHGCMYSRTVRFYGLWQYITYYTVFGAAMWM